MIYLLHFLHFASALEAEKSRIGGIGGWNYVSLHCRNNDNAPVDWWFLYKPPTGNSPFLKLGRNFTYISTDSHGRWSPSERTHISSESMLTNTMAPMFRPTYADNLAHIVYEHQQPANDSPGSTAAGVLMADEMGGVWISHNIPGFPDITSDRATFPEAELPNGHLVACLSVNLKTINLIVDSLRRAEPSFSIIHIPKTMESLLKSWVQLQKFVNKVHDNSVVAPMYVHFKTRFRDKPLPSQLIIRAPGHTYDLHTEFACKHGIILDVYDKSKMPANCQKNCGVRNIGQISIKLPETVIYVPTKPDYARFSVSTAAAWQQKGKRSNQHWMCMGSLDRNDTESGGIMLCFKSYFVWYSFMNLKGREPTCD